MSDVTKRDLGGGWLVLAVLVCLGGFAAGYLAQERSTETDAPVIASGPLSKEVRYKIPVSIAQPKRGPQDALVTIVEWCDLTGTACAQTEAVIVALRKQYGDRIRHVWRHLDETATEDSARAHEFACIAHEHAGKFWEARALLLAGAGTPTFDMLRSYAARLGMDVASTSAALEKRTFAGAPAADQLFAAKFGVAHAPAFFVNGRRLLGAPTHDRLARLIDLELIHAEKLMQKGVRKAQLYDEITKSGLWGAPATSMARSR